MKLNLKTDRMTYAVEDGVGWMIFNNPARHNALSLEMWQAIGEIASYFNESDHVRVVVLTGAGGKAFVSGADISEFDKQRSNAKQKAEYARISTQGNRELVNISKPVLALIQGYCIGGGLGTALTADLRIATPDSTFGIPAAKLGLGYEYDNLAKLARSVGPARARDILFSARFLTAQEALQYGLIQFVFERDEIRDRVIDYAQQMVKNAPLTIQAAKQALNTFENGGHKDEIALVNELVNRCFNSEDYKEGRVAFSEKRSPIFKGH